MQKERTYTLDGLISWRDYIWRELISGIISLLANRRAYILGGLITRGNFLLTWDFIVCSDYLNKVMPHPQPIRSNVH